MTAEECEQQQSWNIWISMRWSAPLEWLALQNRQKLRVLGVSLFRWFWGETHGFLKSTVFASTIWMRQEPCFLLNHVCHAAFQLVKPSDRTDQVTIWTKWPSDFLIDRTDQMTNRTNRTKQTWLNQIHRIAFHVVVAVNVTHRHCNTLVTCQTCQQTHTNSFVR